MKWFLPALYFVPLLAAAGLAQIEVPRPTSLVADGMPPVPASIAADVRRYTEARAASFLSWHPTRLEMLVTTRFGNTNQVHLVAGPLGMRRQLTFFDEPVTAATYDRAKGEFFVFPRDQGGNEFAQLYRYDFKDATITLLTDGGRSQNGGVTWSTKGDRFAYGSTRRNGADRDVYIANPTDPKSDRLLVQLKGGGWGATDWSPDDRTVLLKEYVSINESHLWLVDSATAQKTELSARAESRVAYDAAKFSKDGRGVYLTTDRENEFKRLAYMELGSGRTTFLTSDIKHDIDAIALSHDGNQLAFISNEDGRGTLYVLDTATRGYRKIGGLPAAVLDLGSWHSDNRHLAFGINSARSPTDTYVLDAQTGNVTRWTESETGNVVATQLNEAEVIRWKSFDELEISGFYFRPPAKFAGKRPVIISIHGGPESHSEPVFQGRNNYYLNELGVALIYPNVRGSSGFGKTYVALDNDLQRENSVKDIGALLDRIAQQPELDASRVMITGGSYGGYMTLACAVHFNDRIRCAVDVVGISNWVTFLENTESYRRDLRRAEYGDERDPEMRKFLLAISPQTHAARIKKPLFIIQGANDPRVPRSESVQMVETIRKNGGTVWYLEAKDEGHGFRKKANVDYQFYATVLFVQQHLLGGTAAR